MADAPYTPAHPVQDIEGIPLSLHRELVKLSGVIANLSQQVHVELFVEPSRPLHGQMVYADGTSWNPGSGRGLYYFDTGEAYIVQPVDLLSSPWTATAGVTISSSTTFSNTGAVVGGVFTGVIGTAGKEVRLTYDITATSNDVQIRDSSASGGADPLLATIPSGTRVRDSIKYVAQKSGIYLRIPTGVIGTCEVHELTTSDTWVFIA